MPLNVFKLMSACLVIAAHATPGNEKTTEFEVQLIFVDAAGIRSSIDDAAEQKCEVDMHKSAKNHLSRAPCKHGVSIWTRRHECGVWG